MRRLSGNCGWLSGNCEEAVCELWEGYLGTVRRLSGKCGRLSMNCGEAVWELWEAVLEL